METIKLEDFLKEMEIEWSGDENEILNIIYELEYNIDTTNKPFTFVETHVQRGDGSGEEYFYIFKRKSDGKYFYFYSYDGRVEYDYLEETHKEERICWAFDCHY